MMTKLFVTQPFRRWLVHLTCWLRCPRRLEEYGAWDDTLATAKASFEQARLW